MKVLVTGATGLVGSHLVEELCSHPSEYQVRALVREGSDQSALQGHPMEIATGDLTSPATLARAVAGVEIVFHCAAFVSDWASREEMVRINVTGLEHLLEASAQQGVKRFILVSSMAVLGMDRQENLDESAPTVATGDSYNFTKIEAERLALEFARKHPGMTVTVLRPPYIYGPRDRQMMPRLLSFLRENKFVYIDGGRNPFHLVYVGNLVQAMLLAAKSSKAAGQIYHVTDDVAITRRELVEFIAESLSYARPVKSIPLPVAKAACAAMEVAGKILRWKKTPPLNRFRLKFMSTYLTFSVEKAKRELGYRPMQQKKCLDDTLAWYRAAGSSVCAS